jgi:predicted 3-demethylubiquinone-9 3-methyltransferase (glyoxalase superfamily)
MKEVILHIGLHKTGSTSIQKALKGYNKDGVKAIGFREENHSIPMYTIFSENRYDYHIWRRNENYCRGDIEKKKSDYLKILSNECSNDKIKTLIISGEDLSVLNNSEVKFLADYLRTKKVKTTIICYVRDPLSWIASNSQERVKAGWPLVKIDEIFKRSIQNYMQYFGRENIQIYDFQKSIKLTGSIVSHFSEILSIDIKEPLRQNESLNAIQFALMQFLNTISINTNLDKTRNAVRNKIRKLSSKLLSKNREKLDKQQFINYISSTNREECNWLKKEFGIHYHIPESTEEKNLSDYVDKTLSNSLETINDLFDDIGITYNPLFSLHDNFLNAFTFLETRNKRFDPNVYLELNSDVKAAGANPFQHYLEFGIKEGRRIR